MSQPSSLSALRQRMAARRQAPSPSPLPSPSASASASASTSALAPTAAAATTTRAPQWLGELDAAESALRPSEARAGLLAALRAAPYATRAWAAYLDAAAADGGKGARAPLLRLYIRATRVLPITAANRHDPVYLRIWLALARMQAEDGGDGDGVVDARETFKLMKVQRIGLDNPELYLAWAALEERAANFPKAARLRADAAACRPLLGAAGGRDENAAPAPAAGKPAAEARPVAARTPRTPFGMKPPRRVVLVERAGEDRAPPDEIEANMRSAPVGTDGGGGDGGDWAQGVRRSLERMEVEMAAEKEAKAQVEVPRALTPLHAAASPSNHSATSGSGGGDEFALPGRRGSASPQPQLPPYRAQERRQERRQEQEMRQRKEAPAARDGAAPMSLAGTPLQQQRVRGVGGSGGDAEARYQGAEMRPAELVPVAAAGAPVASSQPREHYQQEQQLHQRQPLPPPEHESLIPHCQQSQHQQNQRQQQEVAASTPRAHIAPFPMPPPENMLTVHGKQYLILEMVGKGGSSKVYKVLSTDMKIYALKRVKVPTSQRVALTSYANEIDLLKSLRGRSTIVQLHDAEVRPASGTIHLIMEYGDIDLAKLLVLRAKGKSISDKCRGLYWQQMLDAVNTIHECKIVHGDLKPANFLHVAGTLKLIDFGIAKAIQTDDTTKIVRDSQIGTPNYMSPEALMAEDDEDDDDSMGSGGGRVGSDGAARKPRARRYRVGRASDIWSLGCILYQMVYGRTPFAHIKNTMHKLHCIQDSSYEISYPATVACNPNLLDVLRGCLQRDPDKRMSMAALISHPYVAEESSFAQSARRMTAPTVQDTVLAFMAVNEELGCAPQDRAVVERAARRVVERKPGGRSSGPDDRTGGHSILRMTPTSSAITGNGGGYGQSSSTRSLRSR